MEYNAHVYFNIGGPLSKELFMKDKKTFLNVKREFFSSLQSVYYTPIPPSLYEKNEPEVDEMIKEKYKEVYNKRQQKEE